MTVTTLRLNDQEEAMFKSFAELTGEPLSTLFKDALREKIEDMFDERAAREALENRTGVSYTSNEVIEMLGLTDEV